MTSRMSGADPARRSNEGYQAADIAAERGHAAVAELIDKAEKEKRPRP